MNQVQISKLEMMKTTNGYLKDRSSVWMSVPVLVNYAGNLEETTQKIEDRAGNQLASQVFIGKSQTALKREVGNKLSILDNVLEAYAADTGNVELESASVNTKTDYYKLSNNEFETKAKDTISKLNQYSKDMVDYGISRTDLEAVENLFDGWLEKQGKPRAYRINSRIATEELKDLFIEADSLLKRMDKVMSKFGLTDPAFYRGYIAARMIVKK